MQKKTWQMPGEKYLWKKRVKYKITEGLFAENTGMAPR